LPFSSQIDDESGTLRCVPVGDRSAAVAASVDRFLISAWNFAIEAVALGSIVPSDSLLIRARFRESMLAAGPAFADHRAFRNDSVPEALGKIDSSAIEQAQWRIAANLNQQAGSWIDGAREQVRDRSYWDIL